MTEVTVFLTWLHEMAKAIMVNAVIPYKTTMEGQWAISFALLRGVVPKAGPVAATGAVPDTDGDGKVSVTETMLQNFCMISCQKRIFKAERKCILKACVLGLETQH